MLITDRIAQLCLFELEDSEVIIVEKVMTKKSNYYHTLIELYNNSISNTRRALEEIIDLIGYFFKYGDDEIENIILTD